MKKKNAGEGNYLMEYAVTGFKRWALGELGVARYCWNGLGRGRGVSSLRRDAHAD